MWSGNGYIQFMSPCCIQMRGGICVLILMVLLLLGLCMLSEWLGVEEVEDQIYSSSARALVYFPPFLRIAARCARVRRCPGPRWEAVPPVTAFFSNIPAKRWDC